MATGCFTDSDCVSECNTTDWKNPGSCYSGTCYHSYEDAKCTKMCFAQNDSYAQDIMKCPMLGVNQTRSMSIGKNKRGESAWCWRGLVMSKCGALLVLVNSCSSPPYNSAGIGPHCHSFCNISDRACSIAGYTHTCKCMHTAIRLLLKGSGRVLLISLSSALRGQSASRHPEQAVLLEMGQQSAAGLRPLFLGFNIQDFKEFETSL